MATLSRLPHQKALKGYQRICLNVLFVLHSRLFTQSHMTHLLENQIHPGLFGKHAVSNTNTQQLSVPYFNNKKHFHLTQ